MKTSIPLCVGAALCLCAACQTLNDSYIDGKLRSQHYHDFIPGRHSVPSGPEAGVLTDTTVWLSAVDVPLSYDWHRDTACGCAEAQIVIFRNFLPVLKIATGEKYLVSTDPDTHHWIDGDLYTEFTDGGRTVIKKNGAELVEYNGGEFLKGIKVIDGKLWTLGQNKNGDGFSLRCDGEVILRKPEGEVFGNLSTDPHDGLYLDCGKLCFCYRTSNTLHCVTDGQEQQFDYPTPYVHDMVISNGYEQIFCSETPEGRHFLVSRGIRCSILLGNEAITQGRICVENGVIGLLCSTKGEYCFHWNGYAIQTEGSCRLLLIYPGSGRGDYVMNCSGFISYSQPGKSLNCTFQGFNVFTKQCAVFSDDRMFLALSPCSGSQKPLLLSNGGARELEINGYLSGVDVCINERQ